MMSKLEKIMAQVDERQDELVSLLAKLISFKTPGQPARNATEAQTYVAQYLESLGFSIDMWEVHPNDPNVVGVHQGIKSDKYQSLILNGHIDVAEVRPGEIWETDPFKAVIRNGYIIGRGAADMKGGLPGALFALKLLKEENMPLLGDVIFQSVIGEEVGEAGTLQCCQRGYQADFALVVDTSDLHIQGQGGVITGWITIKSKKTFHDATRRNMIHAGGGVFGASAIEKMVKLIAGLQELERHWAVTKQYKGYPGGINTINPTVIEGGRHAAFIADECRLWITVHYYPDETHRQVTTEIEEHLLKVAEADVWLRENPPTFEWGGTSMIEDKGEIFPSLEVDPTRQAVKLLSNCHQAVTAEDVMIDVSPSVTDGGWFSEAGIPAAIYGPGDFLHAHAVNEQLAIDQLVSFTKTMIDFIYQWSNQKKNNQ